MINGVFALAAHISVADGDSSARQNPAFYIFLLFYLISKYVENFVYLLMSRL